MQRNFHSALDGIARMSSTRTNYWAEVAVDSSLAVLLLVAGLRYQTGGALGVLLAFSLGLFAFSFIEYFFHRWMFHTNIPLLEQGHRKHHENPLGYDSLPFFLPPLVLVGLAAVLAVVLPTGFSLLMMGAVTLGYIAYGLSHFAIHHRRFQHPMIRRWAACHHVHHHHPDQNFGVTSTLWDHLLGTLYQSRSRL